MVRLTQYWRGSDVDDDIGVAILAILQPKDKSPPATIIIEQFRPPVEKFVVGWWSFWLAWLVALMPQLQSYLPVHCHSHTLAPRMTRVHARSDRRGRDSWTDSFSRARRRNRFQSRWCHWILTIDGQRSRSAAISQLIPLASCVQNVIWLNWHKMSFSRYDHCQHETRCSPRVRGKC